MISSTFPYPPSRGGTEIRTFNLLKYLHSRHEVSLVTQRHDDVSEDDIRELSQQVTHLKVFDLTPDVNEQPGIWSVLGKVNRFLLSAALGTPPNVLHRYSLSMQRWIDQQVTAGKVDVLTCEHGVNAVYMRPSYQQTTQTILNAHSLIYNWMLNHLEMNASDYAMRDRLYLSTIRRYEKRYQQQFTHVVVTTPDDQKALREVCPKLPSTIVANGVDLETFPYRTRDPGGYELVFVGAMDSSHNIDAARFFVTEVMPQLRKIYPEIRFNIVGARPTPSVMALAQAPNVIVTGKVPSTIEYLHRAVICVVPLRAGFGIKNKTLEAMAAGVPVVASDRGLEGLEVDNDVTLRALRANTPDEYVAAICHLLDDPGLRANLSINGRSLVEHMFTWEKAGRDYEIVLTRAEKQHAGCC